MRRKRPRSAPVHPLPRLSPGLTRDGWLAAMRQEWADAHEEGSDRWADTHAALDEIEAFEVSGADAAERIRTLVQSWEATA
ncbi:hypothetical protein GCM10009785_35180 [Brooklawnia cerclae]|uniref:Antitoxin VbhA domain-containing protein n=1 Tax=Brooklawnia cerclae TaxID=349934 RepID=A0ABX0SAD1_9ACTN|nr:hypothetical protein [Brooklawnia cerclae]NIH55363.1 hypothetical protein [Brooklawnia cerclae]